MRALLTTEAGIKFAPVYLKTHTNVIRHVLRNDAAAGGTIIAAFNDESPEVQEQLQIIFKTPDVASHPVVAHPRVPVAVQKALTEALLGLSKDEAGRALLRQIRTPAPVPADYERDYRPLEKLRIEEYVVLG
jgi:phosphonate transport system substrate-binding protein